MFPRDGCKKPVAKLSRGGFQIPGSTSQAPSDRLNPKVERYPKILTQALDEAAILVRFVTPKAMVEVCRVQSPSTLFPQAGERVQQGHGVRPSGDGNQY
jgi:hypothetical protein